MSNKENIHSCTLVKKNGILMFKNKSDETLFELYKSTVGENQEVEMLYTSLEGRANLVKLAKVNIWIKKLAEEIGESPEAIKKLAKTKAGFFVNGVYTSLGDMSSVQLDSIMRELQTLATFVGFNLH
jgi:hypothetical protein